MADYLNIAGRVRTTASDGVAMEAQEVFDLEQEKSQQEVNAEVQAELADRYTKQETYNKEELDNMITTPDVKYVTVTAVSTTTDVTTLLPNPGTADTIYRVGNWDGTQYDASVYSEYSWNGSQYVMLNVKSGNPGDGVFNISVYNAGVGGPATYANLAAALSGLNVPVAYRSGGMSVKFLGTDGKYYQARYMLDYEDTTAGNTDFLNSANWQVVDAKPTAGSHNLVESGGVADEIALSGVYDVSAHNSGATFASLSALLNDANLSTLIPTDIRKGGMSIKFVQTSDNKHVQYFLTKDEWSANAADWQKMNLEDEVNTKVSSAFVNLFNANDENNVNGYIEFNGNIVEYGNYITSGYIPIVAGQTYYKANDSEKGFRFVLMYSAIGEIISGSYISSDTNSFTAVEGAKYARITFYSTNAKNQVSIFNVKYYTYNPVSKYIYDIIGDFHAADVASMLSRIGSIEQFDNNVPINDLTLFFKNVFAITDNFIDNAYYNNSDGNLNTNIPTYACTEKIPVSCSYVRTDGFVQGTCLCYNGDSFIGTVNRTDRKFVLLEGTTNIAFNFNKSDQPEGYREAGIIFNLEPYVPLEQIETRLDELEDFQSEVPLKQVKSLSSGIITISDFFIDNHYYNNADGKFISVEVPTYACTSLIKIDKTYCYTYGFVQSSCLCYSGDSDDAFLGLVSYNNNTERKFTLLEGTTHIAFNFQKSVQPEGYKDSGIIFNLQPFVKDYDPIIEQAISNVNKSNALYGKKWCVCGDSFSEWSTEQDGNIYKTYHYFIKNRNNMTIENMAISGRTMAYPNDHTFDNALAKPSVYQSIPADSDYITIMLGINDVAHLAGYSPDGESTQGYITLGNIDSVDTGTFYGAWNVVMQWIFENRPLVHVGIIITNGLGSQGPSGSYSEYGMQIYTALKAIVEKWNIPFIDLNGGDGKTPMMQRGIYPQGTPASLIAAKWNAFAASPTEPYNGHTNVAGHLYESYCIENFLRSL